MIFTEKEFDTIIEALECLPTKDEAESMISGLFGAVLCKNENREEFKAKMDEKKKQREIKTKRIKEDSTLLIGKVIQMKREAYPNS